MSNPVIRIWVFLFAFLACADAQAQIGLPYASNSGVGGLPSQYTTQLSFVGPTAYIVSGTSITTAGAFFGDGGNLSNVMTLDKITAFYNGGAQVFNDTLVRGNSAATSVATCINSLFIRYGGCHCTATMRSSYATDPEIIQGVGGAPPSSWTCVAASGTCIAEADCSLIAAPNLQP